MADVITRFKLETTQFDSKLRDSARSLSDLTGKLMIAGKDFDRFASKNVEAARALGSIQSGATNTKDKVKDLVGAFNDVARAYNQLTKEQQQTDFGKAMAGSLEQLKGRIGEAKKELYGLGDAMSQDAASGIDFNSVLASLGQRFGINSELLNVLTSGTLASTAAVTAGAAAAAYAAKQWAEYNSELTKQQSMTTTITGLEGGDAENLTMGVRALAKTYDVDFREAIEAANTLIQQFGVSGDQALSLLQDGMQGMIQGDGPKLLNMIQQFAPAFRDAGISADKLVAIIHNSEGGLFSEQNMNAILMGIKNIRLMTKQTSEALAQLGIDGEEMSKKMNDGSMTVFEALQQVAEAIEGCKAGSQEAGQVMQHVFGRQGAMQGMKLGRAIAELNTNLEETKTQTGEVGENLRRVNEATMELENSLQQVFGTAKWDDWNTDLKVFATEGMTFTVEWIGKLIEVNKQWNLIWIGIRKAGEALGLFEGKKMSFSDLGKSVGDSMRGVANVKNVKGSFQVTTDSNGNVVKALRDGKDVTEEYLKSIQPTTVPTTPKKPTGGGKTGTAWSPIEMQSFDFRGITSFGRSVNDVQKDIGKYQKKYNAAEDDETRAAAMKMVEKYQEELKRMNSTDPTKGLSDAYTHDFSKDMEEVAKMLKKEDKEDKKYLSDGLGQLAGGLGGLQSGFEALGVDLGEGFGSVVSGLQGITTILTAIQAIITAIEAINAADALIPLAGGGIVPKAAGGYFIPGNYNSGDKIFAGNAWVNSGELVLNKAEQGNLASQLTAAERGNGQGGTPYVDGEKIFLGINNFLRRSGRGEIVTSR